jgi:hypothetical protein
MTDSIETITHGWMTDHTQSLTGQIAGPHRVEKLMLACQKHLSLIVELSAS